MSKRHPLWRRAAEYAAVQKPQELSELLWLVEEHKPRNVLEIGTYTGGTLLCLCRLAQPGGTIVSVDRPFGAGRGYTEERASEMLEHFPRDGQKLHLVQDDSQLPSTLAQVEAALDGAKLDFLLIDGDHSYEGVKSDFEMYSPLVESSGLIAFHDILEHPPESGCEVASYWYEIRDGYEYREIAAPPWSWGGIGVLWQK
jgi:predicted O-methyltransferase YrrM